MGELHRDAALQKARHCTSPFGHCNDQIRLFVIDHLHDLLSGRSHTGKLSDAIPDLFKLGCLLSMGGGGNLCLANQCKALDSARWLLQTDDDDWAYVSVHDSRALALDDQQQPFEL